ncbi:MAG: transglycosylase SLT domain-containing protein [Elusimicrobia bacterium]|nr:transglycosylase SLT domain-containing protein [Elusimicrobiota bacterium]
MKRFIILLFINIFFAGTLFCVKIPDGNITVAISTEAATQPLTKEEQEEEQITTDTEGENAAVEFGEKKPEVPWPSEKMLINAEKLFRKAVMAYSDGNKQKAGKLFTESLSQIQSAVMPAEAHYYLKDQYENLFLKIHDLTYQDESTLTAKAYKIPMDAENPVVKKYLDQYKQGTSKERIKRALERSGKYQDMIFPSLRKYNLPKELIYLPVVESLYDVNDLSRAGALGIWQFMPQTARGFGLKVNYWIDERKDTEKSTIAAARYLRDLYILFDDWHLALAAYNRGEFGLGRDMHFSQAVNIEQFKDRKAVPKETENYVPQFIAVTLIGDNPKQYGYNLKFDKPIEYDETIINNVIDLKIVAECAKTTVEEIRELNPSIMAWCTPPNYPEFKLKLPKGSKETFLASIATVKDLNPTRGFLKYKVKKGDWIEKIAKKFNTTVKAIKEDNKQLRGKKYLRIGQSLIIRPGKKYFN